jgi:Putative DNA-binding domain
VNHRGVTEATRQEAFLAMLAARETSQGEASPPMTLREEGDRLARGVAAYRTNAEAIAERALAASFGTVRQLVGIDAFVRLASEFWRAHPPTRGDLAEWGVDFPKWLGERLHMRSIPYLEDCARLDRAMHDNERAADGDPDVASLSLLESADPSTLRLHPMPGIALVSSAWPIASIRAAHQLSGDDAEAAFAAVRAAIDAKRGEQVMVVRQGWRATLHCVDAATSRWVQSLTSGADFASAIESAGADFDFASWLATALREGWLEGASIDALP